MESILKTERNAAGMTQKRVAAIIGSHENSVKHWEADITTASGKSIAQLAALFDCDTDYLLGLQSERKS